MFKKIEEVKLPLEILCNDNTICEGNLVVRAKRKYITEAVSRAVCEIQSYHGSAPTIGFTVADGTVARGTFTPLRKFKLYEVKLCDNYGSFAKRRGTAYVKVPVEVGENTKVFEMLKTSLNEYFEDSARKNSESANSFLRETQSDHYEKSIHINCPIYMSKHGKAARCYYSLKWNYV